MVVTDGSGYYSLTGLGAVTLEVRLLFEPGQDVPTQDTITVYLDGVRTEVVI